MVGIHKRELGRYLFLSLWRVSTRFLYKIRHKTIVLRGYDYAFMIAEVIRLRHTPKKVITRNLKIISMTIGQSVKCHDSFNLFRYGFVVVTVGFFV